MKMNSLNNLLAHEIMDLYSAEEQIIDALPQMIQKAQHQELKKALNEHLKITEQQKKRLDKVRKLLLESGAMEEGESETECLGMKGLIEEGQKMMEEDMEPEVMDAAIVAGAQKIEHYEISAYGTACAYARELKLKDVEKLLQQTLDEEYEADERLTALAVGGGLNEEAESGGEEITVRRIPEKSKRSSRSKSTSNARSSSNGAAKRASKTTRTRKSSSSGKTTSRSKSASRGKKSRAR